MLILHVGALQRTYFKTAFYLSHFLRIKHLDRAVVVGVRHKAAINFMNKINPKNVSCVTRKDISLYQSNLAGTGPEPSRIACETHF